MNDDNGWRDICLVRSVTGESLVTLGTSINASENRVQVKETKRKIEAKVRAKMEVDKKTKKTSDTKGKRRLSLSSESDSSETEDSVEDSKPNKKQHRKESRNFFEPKTKKLKKAKSTKGKARLASSSTESSDIDDLGIGFEENKTKRAWKNPLAKKITISDTSVDAREGRGPSEKTRVVHEQRAEGTTAETRGTYSPALSGANVNPATANNINHNTIVPGVGLIPATYNGTTLSPVAFNGNPNGVLWAAIANQATVNGGNAAILGAGNTPMLNGGHFQMLNGGNPAIFSGGNGAMFNGGNGAMFNGGNGAMFNGGNAGVFNGGNPPGLNPAIFNGGNHAVGNNGMGGMGFSEGAARRGWPPGLNGGANQTLMGGIGQVNGNTLPQSAGTGWEPQTFLPQSENLNLHNMVSVRCGYLSNSTH
jgi:hypothetical protein